ncbi:MAG: hypothetical protein QW035_00220 [Candidatus Anstonellales archaeon]
MSKVSFYPEQQIGEVEEAQNIYARVEARFAELLHEISKRENMNISKEEALKVSQETVPLVIEALVAGNRSEEEALKMVENFIYSPIAPIQIKECFIRETFIYQSPSSDPAGGAVALAIDPILLTSKIEDFDEKYRGFGKKPEELPIELRNPEEMFREFTDYHKKFLDDYIEGKLKEEELAKHMLVPFNQLPTNSKQRVIAYRDAVDRSLKKEKIGDILKRAQELESQVREVYFNHLAQKEAPQEVQKKEFELFASFASCAAGHQCLLLSQNKEEVSFLLLRSSMNPRGNEFLIQLYSPLAEGRA